VRWRKGRLALLTIKFKCLRAWDRTHAVALTDPVKVPHHGTVVRLHGNPVFSHGQQLLPTQGILEKCWVRHRAVPAEFVLPSGNPADSVPA
jgi:hypothetical protein